MLKDQIITPTDSFVIRYPEAEAFTKKQLSVFWLPDEIKVEKDVHDILTKCTEAERHGILTVLKLFSLYELFAGRDYWSGVVMAAFPRPEIQRMAATFSMMELAVHQPFYDEINKALGLATDEFYTGYVNDPVLNDRVKFLDQASHDGDPLSLALFSMMEGAILYSSFAYLKHFQSKGKNKLTNIVRGINFSVRDENLHAEAGAWLFKELMKTDKYSDPIIQKRVYDSIPIYANKLQQHEYRIVDMIFEKGKIDGITDTQLKHFVDSRINHCLKQLGLKNMFEVSYNPIADYFYDSINSFSSNDFFSGVGNQYSRNWDSSSFLWLPPLTE